MPLGESEGSIRKQMAPQLPPAGLAGPVLLREQRRVLPAVPAAEL
jgi:hypothetical protein